MKKVIKHTVLIVLTALYCLTFLRALSPYMDYAINQEYIAEVLCVNQDKPELQCNGKCYLKDKLEQEASKEQQDQNSSRSTEKENLFVATAYSYMSPVFFENPVTDENFPNPNLNIQELAIDIPKPPPEA